jgi:hypothetical protein
MIPELLKIGFHVKVVTTNEALLNDMPSECTRLVKHRRAGLTGKVAYIPRQGPIPIFVVVHHDRTNVRAVYHCDELEPVQPASTAERAA